MSQSDDANRVLMGPTTDGMYLWWCPGCEENHGVWTGKPNEYTGSRWSFDGNLWRPTFAPSILTRYTKNPPGDPETWTWSKGPGTKADGCVDMVCHVFIRNGMIEYLGDCTHPFAGRTVRMRLHAPGHPEAGP